MPRHYHRLSRKTLTENEASNVVFMLEDAIRFAGGPYFLQKDQIRHAIRNLSQVKVSSPTKYCHDVLTFLQATFPDLQGVQRLIDDFSLTPGYFAGLIAGQGNSKWHRYFDFLDQRLIANNVSSMLQALHTLDVSGEELQDKQPVALSNTLNVPRVSVPAIYSTILLWAAHEHGVYGDSDPHNTQFFHEHLSADDPTNLTRALFCPHDIADVIIEYRARGYTTLFSSPKYWGAAAANVGEADFRRSFDCLSMTKAAKDHYLGIDPIFASKLDAFLMPLIASYDAFELRDIANSLFIIERMQQDYPDENLPRPCAVTLGAEISIARSKRVRRKQTRPPIRSSRATNKYDMPLHVAFDHELDKSNLIQLITERLQQMDEKQLESVFRKIVN